MPSKIFLSRFQRFLVTKKLKMASNTPEEQTLKDRYVACMVLHGVGDSMGYRGGSWEFCFDAQAIHKSFQDEFGGKIENLKLESKKWPVSDDTVLHLAVAECLVENKDLSPGHELYRKLIPYYKKGMRDMAVIPKGRAPGGTTKDAVGKLSIASDTGFRIPFNPRGAGCGASMRSSCIGLRYCRPEDLDDLIAFSIESGRMTHHLPLGYLGGLVAALFTSYALQGKKLENWGIEMISVLEKAKSYIKKEGYCVKENLDNWSQFSDAWLNYLKIRNIDKPDSSPVFPSPYGVSERDKFYKEISNGGWPGAIGLDSVIIAYDALLGSKDNWSELCLRAMLHGGDNDSTGCIAGSWYGALYGFKNVPENNYKNLEYRDRLEKCGNKLHEIVSGL